MRKSLNTPTRRWTVLIIASTVMMMGYVFWDIVSPLSTTLKASPTEGGMGWTAAEYGFYAGSYSIFNIFLLMLFFGGIILDKCGIRFTGLLATGMMLGGAAVNYLAVTLIPCDHYVDLSFTLFGLIPSHMKVQVMVAAVGFGLFGVGCDITGITISKIVTKWFTGRELATAMGIQVAMARLGTASAISMSPVIANAFDLSAPILAGTALLLMGFVLFIIYVVMDKRFDREERTPGKKSEGLEKSEHSEYSDYSEHSEYSEYSEYSDYSEYSEYSDYSELSEKSEHSEHSEHSGESNHSAVRDEDNFTMRDFLTMLRNPGFWLIALLCVAFYSSLRPFLKFATDVLVNKYGMEKETAGWVVSILPYGTIVLTPLFGILYDRVGRGSLLMLTGCVIVTVCHVCLALPIIEHTCVASVVMVLYGVAFSLVPSAMWPSVPKIVPLKQLGTAYSIIYYVQNIGLMLVPMLVGNIICQHTDAAGHVDYTLPMMVFALFGAASILLALLLMISDSRHHYGLWERNIKKS